MLSYKYKAFISYRHIPFDSVVAERVMRLIETFTPPRSLLRNGKFEKWRCFRDEEELPLSKNLGDDIHEALRDSEFLIIICSPEYNDSKWCLEELRYFKEIHGGSTDNIAVVSISGEPSENFPTDVLSTIEDGVERAVEPLSADIRADNEKQSLKKLNTLYLKMAALFLNCEYNDLVQRQEKRKRKKTIWLFSIVISVLLAFIFVLSISNARIQEKNAEIQEQNLSLQIENSKHNILESQIHYKEGRPLEAVRSALNALPTENNNFPLLLEAEFNLGNVIGAYQIENFQPSLVAEHEGTPTIIGFSLNGNTLITTDTYNLYFWDTRTGNLLNKYGSELIQTGYHSSFIFQPPVNINLELASDAPLQSAFTLAGDTVYENYNSIETVVNTQDVLYVAETGEHSSIYQFNAETGELNWKHSSPENATNDYALIDGVIFNFIRPHDNTEKYFETIDEKSGQVTRSFYSDLISNPSDVLHYYPDKNEIVLIGVGGYVYFVKVSGDGLISEDDRTLGFHLRSEYQNISGFTELTDYYECNGVHIGIGNDWFTADYVIDAISSVDQSIMWEYSLDGINIDTLMGTEMFTKQSNENDENILIIISNKKVILLDCLTGTCLHTYYFQTEIVNYWLSENGYIVVMTDQGTEMALVASDDSYNAILLHQFPSTLDGYANRSGKYAMSQNNSNRIYLFQDVENPDYTELLNRSILNTDKEIQIDFLSDDGKLIHYHEILYDGPSILPANHLVYNTETKKIETDSYDEFLQEYHEEEIPEWIPEERMSVYGLNPFPISQSVTAVIMEDYTIRFYQSETGMYIRSIPIQNISTKICHASCLKDGESAILVGTDNHLYKLSLITGELLGTIELLDLPQGYDYENITFISESNHILLTFWKWEQSYGYHAQKYAWFIDDDSFQIESSVPFFFDYIENTNTIYIFDSERYRFGCIPRFSSDQLIAKAREYLHEQ